MVSNTVVTKADCSKNLQIENRSSSCQRWSLHGFQTSHFICNRFGCKPWLQSIQNHARHHFKAFARCHLKSLCRRPFLRQLVDLDQLLCTGFNSEPAVFFLCHIFTQRPMSDSKIERSDGLCFGQQQLLVDSMRTSFPNEKKICRHCLISTKH